MSDSPKFEPKMLMMPLMLLVSRQLKFAEPNPAYICIPDADGVDQCPSDIPKELPLEDMIQYAQMALITVATILVAAYYFVYSKVEANGKNAESSKTVWMPPKPKPSLPFGLGPPAEPLTEDDFKETTIKDHEIAMVKEAAQGMVMPVAIAYFMSLKMGVHVSLIMQSVMLPINAIDSVILKKYLFGSTIEHGEYTKKPTAAQIKALNDAAAPAVEDDAAGAIPEGESRVEEIKDDDKEDKKKENKKQK